MTDETPRTWFFTFGVGTYFGGRNGYVKFHGTYDEARAMMLERFGRAWSHQYRTAAEAGVTQFNLIEVDPVTGAPIVAQMPEYVPATAGNGELARRMLLWRHDCGCVESWPDDPALMGEIAGQPCDGCNDQSGAWHQLFVKEDAS